MRRIIILAVACLAVYAGLPAAEPDDEQQKTLWELAEDWQKAIDEAPEVQIRGQMDGNWYGKHTDDSRTGYVVGVIDGFYFSPVFGASQEGMNDIHDCLGDKKPGNQMRAIVDKYHAEHPEEWDRPMSEIVKNAVFEICRAL